MCPPDFFDVIDQKNPYMTQKSPVDRVKARKQWESLCSVLQQNGCAIETIEPVSGLEDMVFAANPIFLGAKSGYGKFVVPSSMLYPSRQREVPFFVDWCRNHDYQVIELDYGNDHLEGHGDVVWHPDGSRIYAGYGFRSTHGGVEKFSQAMSKLGILVVPLELIDRFCYHLDTCLCPLNNDAALIYPGAYSADALAAVRKFWPRLHLLTTDEAHQFMGNGIVINGSYIASHMSPQLEKIVRDEGLNPIVIETSEFEKAGGSCFCMVSLLPE